LTESLALRESLILRKGNKSNGWNITAIVFLIYGIILIVLFGAILFLEERDRERVAAKIEKELGSLKAAGYPLSAEDMAKLFPDPPADRDAYRLLKPAIALLSLPDDTVNLPFFGMPEHFGNTPFETTTIEEARKWLDRNQSALAEVPWDKLQGAWIGCSYTNGFTNLTLRRLTPMTGLVRLLCLDAALEADAQQPDKSIQALNRVLMLGSTLKNDVPIHYMLQRASEYRVCVALEHVMNRTVVADDVLRRLAEHLTVTNAGTATREMAIRTLPTGLNMADILKSKSKQLTRGFFSPLHFLVMSLEAQFLYRDRDLLHYLEWNRRCLAALDLPMKEAIPTLLKIEKESEDARKANAVSFLDLFTKERMSLVSFQEFDVSQFLINELVMVAKVRETLAATAIHRWQTTHGGEAPDSLAAIASDVLPWVIEDPFTGRLLHYKKLPHGYGFKCVWPDEDNKKLFPSHRADEHYNITFQVGPDQLN
jgi:hypothetical protein